MTLDGEGMIMQSEINRKVAETIAKNPDLPILLLTTDFYSDDYDSHYHNPSGATVEEMLFPLEVESLYGDTFGLDGGRYYDDTEEVAELIESYWLWDNDHGKGLTNKEWARVYRPIADMMAEDMPWHKYVIIRGE